MKKTLQIKIYLLTLLIIFFTSLISAVLLFYYLDPETNITVALTTMGTAIFLSLSSIFSLIIFFFKKIYYRGEIYMTHLNSSLRQAIMITIYSLGIVGFISGGVYNYKTAILLFLVLVFIELIFQSISD